MKIDLFTLIKSMGHYESRGPSPGKDSLKIGDNLVGRVLEIKSSGKALIDFGRFRTLARTQFSVREGDVIDVKVLEKGVPMRLGLNNPIQGISHQEKKMIRLSEFPSENTLKNIQSETRKLLRPDNAVFKGRAVPEYVKDILARISAHFRGMDMGKNSSELGRQLKSYIENSGIFFEKKIESVLKKTSETNEMKSPRSSRESPDIRDIITKDLKPNIILLKNFLDRKGLIFKIFGAKNLEAVGGTAERLLTEIVARQCDTPVRQDRQEATHTLAYMLPLEESNQKAKLKVHYSKKNRGRPGEGFKVSLLLAMDKIGPIRTDFFLSDKDLNVTFFVDDCTIKEYVDEHAGEIVESLQTYFNRLTLNVTVSENEIEEFEMEYPEAGSAGMLNLRV